MNVELIIMRFLCLFFSGLWAMEMFDNLRLREQLRRKQQGEK